MEQYMLTWNEFRKAHKGLDKGHISSLWKAYKEKEYNLEESTADSNLHIDPNHGHDLKHIAEVEQEIKREEKEQKYLNELNKKETHTGLRSITHW